VVYFLGVIIQDLGLRRGVFQALYKGEARNTLARAVSLYRLGRIHERSLQAQLHHAKALNLVVTAITIWNTVYIEKAVEHLRQLRLGNYRASPATFNPFGMGTY
jgi:TnpA family transposase